MLGDAVLWQALLRNCMQADTTSECLKPDPDRIRQTLQVQGVATLRVAKSRAVSRGFGCTQILASLAWSIIS